MTKLTAINEANEREISSMFGKAVCAYANWQVSKSDWQECAEGSKGAEVHGRMCGIYSAEYEATIRCIDLFVKENLYEIQEAVKRDAKEMMEA